LIVDNVSKFANILKIELSFHIPNAVLIHSPPHSINFSEKTMRQSFLKSSLFGLAFALSACTNPISDEMRSIGFTPNPSPQDNVQLGTLYRVERSLSGIGSRRLTMLCNPITIDRNYLKEAGSNDLQQEGNYTKSNTPDVIRIINSSKSGNVTIDLPQLEVIKASAAAQGSTVRQVYVTVTNAHIQQMALNDFRKMAQHLADKDASANGCKALLRQYAGETEGLMRLFVADVTYRVDAQNASSLNANASFQETMKTELNANYNSTTGTYSAGRYMVYGWTFQPLEGLRLD
jgi:hypothetical protein